MSPSQFLTSLPSAPNRSPHPLVPSRHDTQGIPSLPPEKAAVPKHMARCHSFATRGLLLTSIGELFPLSAQEIQETLALGLEDQLGVSSGVFFPLCLHRQSLCLLSGFPSLSLC